MPRKNALIGDARRFTTVVLSVQVIYNLVELIQHFRVVQENAPPSADDT
nr:MAG TPA: hypothetical protein [Caudoviricetes sp.]